MSPEQRFERGKQQKNEGNELFKSGNFEEAYEKYDEALDMIDWETLEGVIQLKIDLHNNSTLLCIKQQKYKKAIMHSNKALELDPKSIKAFLRKARAYREL